MVDPKVLLIALAVAMSVWLGQETWKGMKWIGHKSKQAAHKIVHPHELRGK